MKKLSNITESIWSDIQKRSAGETKRKEDTHRFQKYFDEIKKIPDSEMFVLDNERNDDLWLPFNFGAKDIFEPGLYLNGDDIHELAVFLKDTEYSIVSFGYLNILGLYDYEYKKINGYWTFIFHNDGKDLYLPNFGYISSFYAEHPFEDVKITEAQKTDFMAYGTYAGMLLMQDKNGHLKTHFNYFGNDMSKTDRIQVRLIKEKS